MAKVIKVDAIDNLSMSSVVAGKEETKQTKDCGCLLGDGACSGGAYDGFCLVADEGCSAVVKNVSPQPTQYTAGQTRI